MNKEKEQERRIRNLEKQMIRISEIIKIQSEVISSLGSKLRDDTKSIGEIIETVDEIHEFIIPKKRKNVETPRYIG